MELRLKRNDDDDRTAAKTTTTTTTTTTTAMTSTPSADNDDDDDVVVVEFGSRRNIDDGDSETKWINHDVQQSNEVDACSLALQLLWWRSCHWSFSTSTTASEALWLKLHW